LARRCSLGAPSIAQAHALTASDLSGRFPTLDGPLFLAKTTR
jgi:hypothetical protein